MVKDTDGILILCAMQGARAPVAAGVVVRKARIGRRSASERVPDLDFAVLCTAG